MPSEHALSPTHQVIIDLLRGRLKDGSANDQARYALSSEELARLIFSNLRGREDLKGMRLSRVGLTMMRRFFKSNDIEIDPETRLTSRHLLFLDTHATMPYFVTDDSFVLFDMMLAVKLKLAGGDFNLVIEMEGGL